MCKESYARGLGRVFSYAIEGSNQHGSEPVAFRPGKTARDHLSGAWSNRLANRAARAQRPTSPAGKKAR